MIFWKLFKKEKHEVESSPSPVIGWDVAVSEKDERTTFDDAVTEVYHRKLKERIKADLFSQVYGEEVFKDTKGAFDKFGSYGLTYDDNLKSFPKARLRLSKYSNMGCTRKEADLSVDTDDLVDFFFNLYINAFHNGEEK